MNSIIRRNDFFFAKWYLEAPCLHLVVTLILFSITSLSISFSIIVYEYKSIKTNTNIYINSKRLIYIFFYIFYISTVLDILFLIESVQQNVQHVSYLRKLIVIHTALNLQDWNIRYLAKRCRYDSCYLKKRKINNILKCIVQLFLYQCYRSYTYSVIISVCFIDG